MEGFCADELWNTEITWNSKEPKLTKCFTQVALSIFPSIFFFVISILEIKFIFDSKNKKISLNGYNAARLVICAFAIYSNLSLLMDYLFDGNGFNSTSDMIGALAKLLSFILLTVIYHMHRIKGVITSGILFLHLLINIISSLIMFLDSILYNASMYTESESNNIYRVFLCYFCLFVLNWWTDDPVAAGLKPNENEEKLSNDIELEFSEEQKEPQTSPKEYSSFISKITWFWYLKLVMKANRTELKINEIYQLENHMRTRDVIKEFDTQFLKEIQNIKKTNRKSKFGAMNLLKVILKTHSTQLIIILALKTVTDLLTFCQPVFLKIMLRYLDDSDSILFHGIFILSGFILTSSLSNLSSNLTINNSFAATINLTTTLSNMVFQKAIKLSPRAKRKRTTGQIINLYAVDSRRFRDWQSIFVYIWSSPLQIVIGFGMLYSLVGNATFFAIFAISFVMLLQYFINQYREKYTAMQMQMNDLRMLLINEVLAGIQVIKQMAWEMPFIEKITEQRRKQIHFIKMVNLLDILSSWVFFSFSPFLILTTTISVYIFLIDPSQFTPEKAFVVISILNVLDRPIENLPGLVSYYFTCKVSLNRLGEFFGEEELENYINRKYNDKIALSIKRSRFAWDIKEEIEVDNKAFLNENGYQMTDLSVTTFINSNKSDFQPNGHRFFELKDIELNVPKGSFVTIIGSVASGKSSLISAILGEMHLTANEDGSKGEVNISEEQSFCYVAQQAWIQNESFKNNILFGKPYDKQRYQQVIDACALEPDLKQFENLDDTEIGEKGINLSGGQKQRVSLARACYSSLSIGNSKQIILLDDPLSAVDAHVSKQLCEDVFNSRTGILKDSTRILVTNQINQLGELNVDQIILLKEGRIAIKCSYEELVNMHNNGDLEEYNLKLIKNELNNRKKEREDLKLTNSENYPILCHDIKSDNEERKQPRTGQLVNEEKSEKGKVRFENHLAYLKYFGFINAGLGFILMIGENFFEIFSRIYLAKWTEVKLNTTDLEIITAINMNHFLIFACISFFGCILNIISNLFYLLGILSSVLLFHQTLVLKVLRSPMKFFDQTPLGRLLNRFNRDIESVDEQLPLCMRNLTIYILKLLSAITLLVIKQPNTIIFYFIVFGMYYYVMNLFITTSRSLKRLEPPRVHRYILYCLKHSMVFQRLELIRKSMNLRTNWEVRESVM